MPLQKNRMEENQIWQKHKPPSEKQKKQEFITQSPNLRQTHH